MPAGRRRASSRRAGWPETAPGEACARAGGQSRQGKSAQPARLHTTTTQSLRRDGRRRRGDRPVRRCREGNLNSVLIPAVSPGNIQEEAGTTADVEQRATVQAQKGSHLAQPAARRPLHGGAKRVVIVKPVLRVPRSAEVVFSIESSGI